MSKWEFADPPNVAVFTSKKIISGEAWIQYVSHDLDDGAWQFHGEGGPPQDSEASVVGLKTIVEIDPTVEQLADLPLGWCACREHRTAPWIRMKK